MIVIIITITELRHSKTILEKSRKVKQQPAILDLKNHFTVLANPNKAVF